MGQNYYAYKHNVQVHNPRPNLLIPRQAEYGQRDIEQLLHGSYPGFLREIEAIHRRG
jgi:hypothetical protein